MVSATEEKAGKLKWWPTCKAKRIEIKAKARARGKSKVELVVKIMEDHVPFLVVEIIYCASARSGSNFARL